MTKIDTLDSKTLYNVKQNNSAPPYVVQALAQYFGVTVVKPDPEAAAEK